MNLLLLSALLLTLLKYSTQDFLNDDYEQVSKPTTSGELVALHKCGEVDDNFMCVPYYRCDGKTRTIIPEHVSSSFFEDVVDVRIQDNYCDHILEVCCKKVTVDSTTKATTLVPVTDDPDKQRNRCGIRNVNGVDFRITDSGDVANFGEFPWIVEILLRRYASFGKTGPGICGGSLVTPDVILTAAHCVYNFTSDDLVVRAGEWDTQTDDERIPHQERDVVNIILHPQFNPRNLHNDPALLVLNTAYSKTRHVGTICLPPQGLVFNSKNCIVAGWGKNKFGSQGVKSIILKKLELPIVPHSECQEKMRQTRLGKYFVLDQSFVCAGGERGLDACTGDGGAPLVCPDPSNPQRYYQAGIVAWSIDCGADDIPGVYVNVANFRDWIDQTLKRFNISPKPYLE